MAFNKSKGLLLQSRQSIKTQILKKMNEVNIN